MEMKKKIVVGNWKMNPPDSIEAKRIFSHIKRAATQTHNVRVVICPADIYLVTLSKLAEGSAVSLGAQDVFWEDRGRFTGQISPAMAYNAGARFVIVGHSEKRALGETSEETAHKLLGVTHDGMYGILCIGESVRDKDGAFFAFLKNQLLTSLSRISRETLLHSVLIAYEPVWAIGKAGFVAMNARDIHETSIFIRKVLHDAFGERAARTIPILYGGSVSPDNAHELVYKGEIDGLLVGRESLDPIAFSKIIKSLDAGK